MKKDNDAIERITQSVRSHRFLRPIIAFLCIGVVFLTAFQLRSLVDALSRIPTCGYEEHTHTDSCYDESGNLICGLEEHVHTDACYQERPRDTGEEGLEDLSDGSDSNGQENAISDNVDAPVVEEGAVDLGSNDADDNAAEPEEICYEDGSEVQDVDDVSNPVYDIDGFGYVLLSDILASTYPEYSVDDIEEAGESILYENQPLSVSVAPEYGDYGITILRDFIDDDMVEMCFFTKDGGVYTVDLKNGVVMEPVDANPPSNEVTAEETAAEDIPSENDADVTGKQTEVGTESSAVTDEESENVSSNTIQSDVVAPSVDEEDQTIEPEEPVQEETAVDVGTEDTIEDTTLEPTSSDDGAVETQLPEEGEPADSETEGFSDDNTYIEENVEENVVDLSDGETADDDEDNAITEDDTEAVENGDAGDITEYEIGAEDEGNTEAEDVEMSGDDAEDTTDAADQADVNAADQADVDTEDTNETETEVEAEVEAVTDTEDEGEPEGGESEADDADRQDGESDGDDDTQNPITYSADADMADLDIPFSLNALMAKADAEQPDQPETDRGLESAVADDVEPVITYDESIFSVEPVDGDYIVTPLESFEDATITVEKGNTYVLNLHNYTMPEAATSYPLQSFEAHVDGTAVYVVADEGAFPAGTTMEVVPVYDESTLDGIASSVEEDGTVVRQVHAVDITFRNAAGEEIEPLIPISVVINVEEIRQTQDAVVVHVDDEGNTEVVEQTESGEEEVAFDTDSFSVYAVVMTQHYISADGQSFSIQVTYGSGAEIPEDAALKVREVDDQDYIDRAAEIIGDDCGVRLARFFDITIMSKGEEIQPAAPVEVRVTLDDAVEADHVKVVHFGEENVSVIENDSAENVVTFDAESFSVYGIVYTVDFEYNGYTWHFPGLGSYKIADIMAEIGVSGEISDVSLRRVDDRGGDANVLYLSADRSALVSDAAFEDTFELTVVVDGATYVLVVTDAVTPGYTDLESVPGIQIEFFVDEEQKENKIINGTEIINYFKLGIEYSTDNETWLASVRSAAIEAHTDIMLDYDLSSLIDNEIFTGMTGSGKLYGEGGEVGYFMVENAHVLIHLFTSKIGENATSCDGSVLIYVYIDSSTIHTERTEKIKIPGQNDELTIYWPGQQHAAGTKRVNKPSDKIYPGEDGNDYLEYDYTLTINGTPDLTQLKLTDYLPAGMTLKYNVVNIRRECVTKAQESNLTTTENGSYWGNWADVSSSTSEQTAQANPVTENGKAVVDVLSALNIPAADTETEPVVSGTKRTRTITQSTYTLTYTGRIKRADVDTLMGAGNTAQLENTAIWNEGSSQIPGGKATITITRENLIPGTKVIDGGNPDKIKVAKSDLITIDGKEYVVVSYSININEPIDASSAVLEDVLSQYQKLHNSGSAKLLIDGQEPGIAVTLTAANPNVDGNGGKITFDLAAALAGDGKSFTRDTNYTLKYDTLVCKDNFDHDVTNSADWTINGIPVDGGDKKVFIEQLPYEQGSKWDNLTDYFVYGDGPWDIPWTIRTQQKQTATNVELWDKFSEDQAVKPDSFKIWVGNTSYNVPSDATYLHVDNANHTFTIDFDEALKALTSVSDPAFKSYTEYKVTYTSYTSRYDHTSTTIVEKSENQSKWTFDGDSDDWAKDEVVLRREHFDLGKKTVTTGNSHGVTATDGKSGHDVERAFDVDSVTIRDREDNRLKLHYRVRLSEPVGGSDITKALLTDTYDSRETLDTSTMIITINDKNGAPIDVSSYVTVDTASHTFRIDYVQALNGTGHTFDANTTYYLQYYTYITLDEEIKALLKSKDGSGNTVGFSVFNNTHWTLEGKPENVDQDGNQTKVTFKEKPFNGGNKTVSVSDTATHELQTEIYMDNGHKYVCVDSTGNTLTYTITLREDRAADNVVLHDEFNGSGTQTLNMDSIMVSYIGSNNEVKQKPAGEYATRTDKGFDLRLSDMLKEKFYSSFKAGREYTVTYTVTTTGAEVEGDTSGAVPVYGNGGWWSFDGEEGDVGETEIHLIIPEYKPGTKSVRVREAVGASNANKSDWQALNEPENYSDSSAPVSHVVYSATNANPYHLDYTISIRESRRVDTATLTDTFRGNADQALDVNSFTLSIEGDEAIYAIPSSYISASANGFTMNFTAFLSSLGKSFEKSRRYDIHFTTTTTTCNNLECDGDGADNQAKWTFNDAVVEGGHTETHIKKVTTIQKTYYNEANEEKGEVDFGQIVKYVVTIGEQNQRLNGMTIRDDMHHSHHIFTDSDHKITITVKDANGDDVSIDLVNNRPNDWGFYWNQRYDWAPGQFDNAFTLIFPGDYQDKQQVYGPATLVYYARVGTQQQIDILGEIPVRNTVYSDEATITTEFKLTSGTVKLEKRALDISGDTLETGLVEAWWAVDLTPISMSLKDLVLIDYDSRYSMVSAQAAADGTSTNSLSLDFSSVRVNYINASDDHAAGDPVPNSLYHVDGNGKIRFGDIAEPVTVVLKTQEKYNYKGGNIYMRNSARITDKYEQKIIDYDTTDKQYEEAGTVSAQKSFSSYEETDDDTIINWVITVNTTDDATVYGYSIKEVINLMRYSTVSPQAAASYDNSYTLNYDYYYGNVVVKQGDTVLQKGVDYEADQNIGVKFIKRLKGPITIEIPSTMGKRLPSGMIYLYNKAVLKDRTGGEEEIIGRGEIENYRLDVDKQISPNKYPTKPEEFGDPVYYTVVVNANKGKLPEGQLTLTDVLPAGMEFNDEVGLYTYLFVDTNYDYHWITRYDHGEEYAKLKPNVTSTTLADGRVQQTVTVDFSAVSGLTLNQHQLTFTYQAKLSQAEQDRLLAIGTNEAQVYKNTITFKQGDKVEGSGDVKWSYEWNNGLEKKDITNDVYGKEDHKPYIYYRVTINPEARRMNDGKEMVLSDTIATSMELQLDSITVKDRSGNPIADAKVSYDGITRKLTVRVPDETTCLVEYMTRIENAALHAEGTFTNTAELYGESVWTDDTEETHRIDTLTGVFHYNVDNGFVIEKVDGNNVGQKLKGAEFTLYKASFSGMSDLEALLSGTYANYLSDRDTASYDLTPFRLNGNDNSFKPVIKTSGDDGTAVFEHLQNFTLYYWKETKTPGDDYSAGEFANPQYLILYPGSDEDAYNKANLMDKLFEDANGITVNKAVSPYVWTATNVKYTQHRISKIWEDNDDAAGKRPDRIWVQLYQDGVKYDDPNKAGNDGLVEISANNLGKWEHTWFDLPATRQGGVEYVYTAAELTPDQVYDENLITEAERDALKAQMKFYSTLYTKITGGTEITNRLKDETTLLVIKAWEDNNNSAMLQPGSITVRLYRETMSGPDKGKIDYMSPKGPQDNTVQVSETPVDIVISARDKWKADFSGLVTADGDVTYRYYLEEQPVTGYVTRYSNVLTGGTAGGEIYGIADSDGIITITNTVEPLSLHVAKHWTNFAIPYGYKVRVYYNLHRYIVSGDTLTEDTSFTSPTTAVCYSTLSGSGASWENLPRLSEDGQSEYRYQATEKKVELIPSDWIVEQNEPAADKIDISDLFTTATSTASLDGNVLSQTIVNTVPKTKVVASKVWKNPDGTDWKENLPASVTFTLYRLKEGEEVTSGGVTAVTGILDGTVDAAGEGQPALTTGELTAWHYTWDGLDAVYWDAAAKQYKDYAYVVREASVDYDSATYTIGDQTRFIVDEGALTKNGANEYALTITNVLNEKDVEFGKQWRGQTPEAFKEWVKTDGIDVKIRVHLFRRRAKLVTDDHSEADSVIEALTAADTPLELDPTVNSVSLNGRDYAVEWSGGTELDSYIYKFTIKGLEKYYNGDTAVPWTYYIEEEDPGTINGVVYERTYSVTGQTHAKERGVGDQSALEYIINSENTSFELPSTGGSGTAIFYVLGSVLVLLAAALLVARRRTY